MQPEVGQFIGKSSPDASQPWSVLSLDGCCQNSRLNHLESRDGKVQTERSRPGLGQPQSEVWDNLGRGMAWDNFSLRLETTSVAAELKTTKV